MIANQPKNDARHFAHPLIQPPPLFQTHPLHIPAKLIMQIIKLALLITSNKSIMDPTMETV